MRGKLIVLAVALLVLLSACTGLPRVRKPIQVDFGEGFIPSQMADGSTLAQILCQNGKNIEFKSNSPGSVTRTIANSECPGLYTSGVRIAVASTDIMYTPACDVVGCTFGLGKPYDKEIASGIRITFFVVVMDSPNQLVLKVVDLKK